VYKFNGKELDESTGYYYYGARYYDPAISIFLSVDPLAEKYYHINPYTYVANNPINAIDPDGRDIIHLNGKGTIVGVQNDGKSHLLLWIMERLDHSLIIPLIEL
jgi:RHS repeat-associated protein